MGWMAFLTAFLAFALAMAASSSAQNLELTAGLQATGISADMVNKQLGSLLATCGVDFALVYDAKGIVQTQPDCRQENWVTIDSKAGSLLEHCKTAITENLVGMGLFILTSKPSCTAPVKGFSDSFGHSGELASGTNLISIPDNMRGSSFGDLANGCEFISIMTYEPAFCQAGKAAEEGCVGNFYELPQSFKIDRSFVGKAVFVTVENDCTLKDVVEKTQAAAASGCSEAECAAKSSCEGAEYKNYRCVNDECVWVSRRDCAAEEKAALGVDLVPAVEIRFPSIGQVGAGDVIEIIARVRNVGKVDTYDNAVKKNEFRYTVATTVENAVTNTPVMVEYKEVSTVDRRIPGGGEVAVASYKWTATESSFRIKVKVDINNEVTETGVAESNNEALFGKDGKAYEKGKNELIVKPASTRLPDLVVEEGKISVIPKVVCRPAAISTIAATVKNIGRTPANAQGQFLEAKAYVKEKTEAGEKVVCSSLRMQNPPRWLVTLNPGEEFTFTKMELTDGLGNVCVLQPGKEYVAAVDADTLSVVAESNEDNLFTAPIVDETKCEEAATRQGTCYCDFDKKPKTQRKGNEACTHNFECKTEICIRNKCVSSENAKRVLSILGYS